MVVVGRDVEAKGSFSARVDPDDPAQIGDVLSEKREQRQGEQGIRGVNYSYILNLYHDQTA